MSADADLKQKAAAAFRALAEGDRREFERIDDAIPRCTIEIADVVYTLHLQALKSIAQHYAIQHWQRQARLYVALFGATQKAAAARPMEAELLALDRAVARLAEIHGFDVAAMRRLAGIDREGFAGGVRHSDAAPDPQTEERMFNWLGSLLEDDLSPFEPSLKIH